MKWMCASCAMLMCGLSARPVLSGDHGWPEFVDQTATRLIAGPSVGVDDTQEKDYAWGDFDQDGDIDLVCVRKQPWNTPGRFRNVLFMNEGIAEGHAINGVLVDRTAEYATAATDGGQGLLDATADRDVAVVDVDGDGWLDIVTAATYGQGLPKSISHPRIYINQRSEAGQWQGFRFEHDRTPTMPIAPNFCGIGFGDVSGDSAPDLYFVDYNNDLEDRLWINDGTGTFIDESEVWMTPEMLRSDFGIHAVIADMNNDGVNDVLKDRGSSQSTPPIRVTISYNNPDHEGSFDVFDVVYVGSPYHAGVGDLNSDGLLDIVVDDDGIDRYFLNQGNGPDGTAEFLAFTLPPESNSFGGNIVITDIDRDGHNDVLIADVDVDCCGCSRHMHFWHNLGDVPNVSFEEEDGGIPIAARTGTHDVAVFDINGDDWLDFVIGTCTGTSVWISVPPIGIEFSYPEGRPELLAPNEEHAILVQLDAFGEDLQPATATLHYSANGDPFSETLMAALGGNLYEAMLPGFDCLDQVDFYFSAALTGGAIFTDPPEAPTTTFSVFVAEGFEVTFSDAMEGDVSGWTIVSDPSLESGEWEQAEPHGTIFNGDLAAPDKDATPGDGNVMAFVTQNCTGDECSNAGDSDVDGGPTHLISPTFDLSGTDATIRYARWFYTSSSGGEDFLLTEVSNDGGQSWTSVHATTGTDSAWEMVEFVVSDFVAPTAEIRVRFGVADAPEGSIVEAGIDDFEVEQIDCGTVPCDSDLDGDGSVGAADLAMLLGSWGPCQGCPADFDGDGAIGAADLAVLLGNWGACP